MSYQKTYETKIGKALLDIDKAIAGSKANCKLTYTVGELGIDDSGSIKVLLRIVTDAAGVQFDNPQEDNYVKLSSSRKDIAVSPGFVSGGLFGKVDERPWSKGFTVNFSGDYLIEGDKVFIEFKNWRMQTFYENDFEFRILVDPFATARYITLPNCPEIKILPDKPARVVVITPTLVKKNKKFTYLVKLEDKWGNPCFNYNGEVSLKATENIDTGNSIKISNGRAIVDAELTNSDTGFITATFNSKRAISNPIVATDSEYNQYWADLHGQTEETVGTNDITHYFSFARDYAFLDVACIQGNDFQITNEFWKKTNKTTKVFTDKKFVAIPGYEWSGNTATGGDRNVLYRLEGMPIYRSSHALVDEFDDIATDAYDAHDLFKKLMKHGKDAMTIAHVGGRFADLDMHHDEVERNVEVHSDWGTFEWFLHYALDKGYTVGVVANSDGHTGRPGASYPAFAHFNNYGGYTCILANNLTRDSIYDALRDRHCYATTGIRAYLDVTYTSKDKQGIMGDIVKTSDPVILNIDYRGTAPIERLEIFNASKVIHTHSMPIRKSQRKTIKVLWSGSKVKGRKRGINWNGKFTLKDNSIKKLTKINFYNQKNFVNTTKTSAEWNGGTTGGVQGLIVTLEKDSGKLNLVLNDKEYSYDIASLDTQVNEFSMGGLDAKLQVYQTHSGDKPDSITLDYTLKKSDLSKKRNPIYVKVTQKDGNMVWSSPIYIE